MIIFVVSVALLTLCNLATFLLSLPSKKSFAKLRVRKSATCEWYCERSLSDMRNTIRILQTYAHATLRMTSNKAPLVKI
jgi:hypothetical protein